MATETPPPYQIVRATAANIAWLAQLFEANGSGDTNVDRLRRKYDTSYTGHAYFAHFAVTPEGIPAAFFCLFPSFLNVNGQKVLAGQSADIITHPSHQRKGLFGLLGKATEALAKEHGMLYLFAFPNANSFPGFVRSLGWQHMGNFQNHFGQAPGFAWFRLFRKLKQEALYNRLFHALFSRFRLAADDARISTISGRSGQWRDARYYAYKSWNGSFWIAFRGFAFWIRREADLLLVGDIRKLPEAKSDAALQSILELLCQKVGLTGWRVEVLPETPIGALMHGVGKTEEGVFVVYSHLENRDERLPLDFAGGDTDVF
jgi:GNAT superfamily N-acetyltransferase